MQVSVVIYNGSNYESHHEAFNDGAVYDYILDIELNDLTMQVLAVSKALSIAEMLIGTTNIIGTIVSNETNKALIEFEFSELDYQTLENVKSFAVKKKFKYLISTNVIWFGGDNGEVWAETYEEALKLAQKEVIDHVKRINEKIKEIDILEVDLGSIEVEEV